MLENSRILIAGPTGQVGLPVACALAESNEVWGVARFSDDSARARLEEAGVKCIPCDLATGSLDALPDDFAYLLNFSVVKTRDFNHDLAVNAEAVGFLMSHCKTAHAYLHCSSTAVYQANGHRRFKETDPLGDNHRVFLPTYSICKIAAEAVAKFGARHWRLPTTIARLNVPYGDNGGWPALHLDWMLAATPIAVHSDSPSIYNPIHESDIIEQVPKLLAAADVPAVVVNWAGRDQVSIEDWCAYMGKLTGVQPEFVHTDQTLESVTTDNTLMHQLIGETTVDWRQGMERMARLKHPEAFK